MVKIQIELSEEENRLVDLFKAEKSLETKEIAIKEMIKRAQKCEHQYALLKELNFLKQVNLGYTVQRKPAIKFVQRCVRCGHVMENVVLAQE